MKIWYGYGSEHSMNLVMIGVFKEKSDAGKAKQIIDWLAEVGSHAISNAVDAGTGQVEALELGHRYGHLSPLVNVA